MAFLKIILFLVYIFLIFRNYNSYKAGIAPNFLIIFTTILLIFLLCSSNLAFSDWSDTSLDISGYRTVYEKYDVLEHPDFMMYYIFYSCMYIGQYFGLSYGLWWTIMSVLAMSVIIISCRVHHYSLPIFFGSFMMYHVFVMYSGLKFFYGFCFLFLAYGFFIKSTLKGRILFAIFTCVAGGLHTMYYFFLLLLLNPPKGSKYFVNSIIAVTFVFTLLMRVSGSAVSFLTPFFATLDNDHIDIYTKYTVNFGFYIALALHFIVVYLVYRVRKFKVLTNSCTPEVDALYYSTIVSLIFCPFYALALTFMRLITAFSLVVIIAGSGFMNESYKSRKEIVKLSLLVVGAFILMKLITGAESFIQMSVLPFFDVL